MGYDQEKRAKVLSTPQSGARRPAGKTDSCDESLRSGSLPKSEDVKTVDMSANSGTAVKAALVQAQGDGVDKNVTNGNPKKRESNSWGLHHGPEK